MSGSAKGFLLSLQLHLVLMRALLIVLLMLRLFAGLDEFQLVPTLVYLLTPLSRFLSL